MSGVRFQDVLKDLLKDTDGLTDKKTTCRNSTYICSVSELLILLNLPVRNRLSVCTYRIDTEPTTVSRT